MATQPDEQFTPPEPQQDGGSSIGAGALATAGLGLIALAILIWFLYPRFSAPPQPAPTETPGTVIAELVTATPLPTATTAPLPTKAVSQAPTTIPTSPPATAILPTPTLPVKVQAGVYAKVVGTGTFGLRLRSGPGQDYVTWRILPEGEILKITGGPEEADGVIWWRAQDKTGLVGWTAEQYLVPVEPPAWTPEPERTPDIRKMTLTPGS
jgi:hypothetical protein